MPTYPLVGPYDLDPGRWRPLYYPCRISVPVAEGGIGRNSVTINNQPFVWRWATHMIVGNTADPSSSGLYQDGQYLLSFRDEQSNYQSNPIPAPLMFGNAGVGPTSPGGFLIPLPYPIPYAGNKTITWEVTNLVTRTLSPTAEYFAVWICMAGTADWGTTGPRG